MSESFANVNALWSAVLIRTWQALGLRHAVVSPGSRSTPLTVTLARTPGIRSLPVLDERSAAFLALGLARQTRRPVMLVCTSGSAGAHYLPALIEARLAGVPLLVVTADRPPEMRHCSSGQTIEQQNLFGVHASAFTELPVPSADTAALEKLALAAASAWRTASGAFPGPVHLNQPFRDPLAPDVSDGCGPHFLAGETLAGLLTLALSAVPDTDSAPVCLPSGLASGLRSVAGLIVAGHGLDAHPSEAEAVRRLAEETGWPVLADTLSGLRSRAAEFPHLVSAYDLIVRNPALAETLRPSLVVQFGPWPTSKTLRSWLGSCRPRLVSVWGGPESADCLHLEGVTVPRPEGLPAAFASLPNFPPAPADWTRRWLRADTSARSALSASLAASPAATESRLAPALLATLPSTHTLFLANSMAVRDAEWFCQPRENGPAIAHHRGANGIDGLVSSALGRACGPEAHVVLLCGDLAFLHDSNALLSRRHLRGSLTVVVVNNNGGGIFESLPVSGLGPVFEEFFATPQEADLGRLCAAHGVPHRVLRDARDLPAVWDTTPGLRVLEVRTDRKADMAWRKAAFAAASSALG